MGRLKNKILNFIRFLIRTVYGTWRQMKESDVQLLAGSLAFSTVISLVPLLAVSLSVFKAFGGFDKLMKQIEPFIIQNFVEASGAQISKVLDSSIKRVHSGTLGVGGVIALLFTSTKLFLDMETAIQRVWQETHVRPIIRRILVYWVVMFLGPLVVAVALGLLGSKDLGLIRVLPKGSLAFAVTFVGFFLIYKWVPARPVKNRSALPAAAAAAIAVALAQSFYALFTKNLLSYSKIYGSLASIPVFLLWILILWWICLGGVALSATIDKELRREPRY